MISQYSDGNEPLHEPMLTKIYVAMWRHNISSAGQLAMIMFNTVQLGAGGNDRTFADDISNAFFWKKCLYFE